MVIKAHLLGHHIAFAQRIHAVEQLFRLLGRIRVRVRTEIFRFIFKHPPGHLEPGMRFIRNFDIREGFVVLQKHVITRMMLLNEVALQNERLHVASGYDIFEIADFRDQPLRFSVMAAGKIRTDPVFQHFGFADIDDFAVFVFH